MSYLLNFIYPNNFSGKDLYLKILYALLFWMFWYLLVPFFPDEVFGYLILGHSIFIGISGILLWRNRNLNYRDFHIGKVGILSISLGYIFLSISDLFWATNYFFISDTSRNPLGFAVSFLISLSFLSFSLGIILSIEKPYKKFFNKKIVLSSLVMSISFISTILVFPCYASKQALFSSLFGWVEILSISTGSILFFLSIIVLFSSSSIRWSTFGAGLMCLVLADSSIRIEKIIEDNISFDAYSVLFSVGLYSSLFSVLNRETLQKIEKPNFNSLFASYKIWSICIIFCFLLSFLYSQFGNLDILRPVIFFSGLFSFALIYLSYSLVEKIKTISSNIARIFHGDLDNDYSPLKEESNLPAELLEHYKLVIERVAVEQKNKIAHDKLKEINTALKHVAHNILSPIAVLNAIINENTNNEESKILTKCAMNNICDIANSLLRLESEKEISTFRKIENCQISSLIELVISRKRVEINRTKKITIEYEVNPNNYLIFSNLDVLAFDAVLSNILNNSIEAILDVGQIVVSLKKLKGEAVITIKDNGSGIANEVFEKIKQEGFTTKEDGHGIGLKHASSFLSSIGGRIEINNRRNQGAQVCLHLPTCSPSKWFVPNLKITAGMTIVVLDDNFTIHQLWAQKLGKIEINLKCFSHPDELVDWLNNQTETKNVLFLLDYDLGKGQPNGINLAKRLSIIRNCVLVTSYFYDREIRSICSDLGLKLISKNQIKVVPLVGDIKRDKCLYDAVLIDDDIIVQDYWKLQAKKKKKKLRVFSALKDFYNEINLVDIKSPIFIDSEISPKIKGEIEARLIRDMYGFKNIILCTSKKNINLSEYPWLNCIQDKESPW